MNLSTRKQFITGCLWLLAVVALAMPASAQLTISSPTSAQTLTGCGPGFAGCSGGVMLTATPSSIPAATDRICWNVDAYNVFNPGYGSPYFSPLASQYVAGCSGAPPFSVPFNSFWVADGPHTFVATAYDVLGNTLSTSAGVSATVANLWPVNCSGSAPSYTVTSSEPLGSPLSGVVTLTITATGACATDLKTVSVLIDGVYSYSVLHVSPTSVAIPMDTRVAQDSDQHILAVNVIDEVNGATIVPAAGNSYQGAAGEWSQVVTFANTTSPVEVRQAAHELYLQPSGTGSMACTLLEGNGTAVSTPTCDYFSSNTAVATVNSSGLVTAASSVPASGQPANANIYAIAETVTGTDGYAYSGNGSILASTAVTFTTQIQNSYIKVSGGTSCTPGLYSITSVNTAANIITLGASIGNSCTGATFGTGPARQGWAYVAASNAVPYFGSDGTIHTTPGYSKTYFINEAFSSVSCVGGPIPYSPGCLAEFASSGMNTVETGLDFGVSWPLTSGGQSAYQSSQTAYANDLIASTCTAYPQMRLYLTGDNFWRQPSYIWQTTRGPQVGVWSSPPLTISASSFVGCGILLGLADEGAAITSAPLQGPLTLAAAGTAQNWLGGGSIVALSGVCTVTGSAQPVLGESNYFVITGSVTANMNSVLGSSQYVGNTFVSNTFKFTCTGVADGTYNSTNDSALTIQPLGLNYYHDSTSTGYINYDALAVMSSQLASVTNMYPYSMNVAAGTNCQNIAGWSNGVQTLAGQSQAGTYADLYTSNGFLQYLMARVTPYSIVNPLNNVGMGVETRQHFGCFNPALPLVLLTPATFTGYGIAPLSNLTIATQVNDVFTFTTPHHISNVVPSMRLAEAGSSNSALNGNYYCVAVLSPTQLQCEYATGTIAGASGTGSITATFSPSGYSTNLVTSVSEPSTPSLSSINYPSSLTGAMFGGRFFLSSSISNVPLHRGEIVTFSGVTGGTGSYSSFNTLSFLYLPYQPSAPSHFNAMVEIPSGSGTGGTATIVADNTYVAGRSLASTFAADQPSYSFICGIECMILRCAAQRSYKLDGPMGMSSDAVGGFSGDFESVATDFTDITNNNAQSQLFSYPHFANGAAVDLFHATSRSAQIAAARAGLLFQPSLSSPDLGGGIDCAARSGTQGAILVCVNLTAAQRTVTINTTPYLQSGQNFAVDHANWQYVSTTTVSAGTSSETITLGTEEAAALDFPATFSGYLLQPTASARLADVSGATGWAIRYGQDAYTLDALPGNVFDCGSAATCTPPVDLNIGLAGKHPYRIIYYGSGGQVLARSDVQYQ